MLEINFLQGNKNILVFHLNEVPGSKPEVFSGDDSWFDYSFQPYSNYLGRKISCEEAPEQWAIAIADSYRAANSSIQVDIKNAGEPVVLPPQPEGAINYNSSILGVYNGRTLSGWWPRAGALILDGLFISLLMSPLLVISIMGMVGSFETTTLANGTDKVDFDAGLFLGSFFLAAAGSIAVGVLYYCLTMARTGAHNGQTWGKQLLNITVIREDGEQVGFGFSFVRQILVIQILFGGLGYLFFGIPYILNYLWPLWDNGNQALHDKIVHSRVVRTDA